MPASPSTVVQGTTKSWIRCPEPSVVMPASSSARAMPRPPARPTSAAASAIVQASTRKMRVIWRRVVPSACSVAISRTRSTSAIESVWKITYRPSTSANRPARRTPFLKARSCAAAPTSTLLLSW